MSNFKINKLLDNKTSQGQIQKLQERGQYDKKKKSDAHFFLVVSPSNRLLTPSDSFSTILSPDFNH